MPFAWGKEGHIAERVNKQKAVYEMERQEIVVSYGKLQNKGEQEEIHQMKKSLPVSHYLYICYDFNMNIVEFMSQDKKLSWTGSS